MKRLIIWNAMSVNGHMRHYFTLRLTPNCRANVRNACSKNRQQRAPKTYFVHVRLLWRHSFCKTVYV
jgi:hypothetical protein